MISHRHRCIYVKVPKCASTTVLDWFAAHGGGRHSFRPYWYGGLLAQRVQAVARTINLYPDYRTFSFVRNPYERFVSTWRSARGVAASQTLLAGNWPGPESYDNLGDFAQLCNELLADFRHRWGRDAEAFFRAHAEREYGPAGIKLKHLGWVVSHIPPQTDFLPNCNPERLFGVPRVNADRLSFIGSVETLDSDFAELSALLGLSRHPLPVSNASGTGGRYAALYDAATRRIVEEIYADDLAFTGFGFDGGRTASAPPYAQARDRSAADTTPASNVSTLAQTGTGNRRGLRTRSARAWQRLAALEIMAEERMVRSATVRRVLRPLKVLRGLPR